MAKKQQTALRRLLDGYYPARKDGVRRRIVLDTNCAWYAQPGLFAVLRDAGFLISLSPVAVSERWARASSNGDRGMLATAARIDPYLDPNMRFAFSGWALEDQLGYRSKDEKPPDGRLGYTQAKELAEKRWAELVEDLRGDPKVLDQPAHPFENFNPGLLVDVDGEKEHRFRSEMWHPQVRPGALA